MENILGEQFEGAVAGCRNLGEIKLHLYGKKDAKPKRKMGHLTVMAASTDEAQKRLRAWQDENKLSGGGTND